MLESYYKLQPKPKTVPEFKDAPQLIWSALQAINSAMKDFCKRLQASVSSNSENFEYII